MSLDRVRGQSVRLLSAVVHPTRIDDPRLKEVLYKAFRSRLPEVMDQSQHASQSTAGGGSGVGNVDQQAELFLAGMDEWEKERGSTGFNSAYQYYDAIAYC